MKFLHTSDWHIGAMDNNRSLLEDQKFFIDEIARIIEEKNVDAVIISGDVYDRQVVNAEAIKLYDYAMIKICRGLNIPVLTIAGNHDSPERLSSCRELLEASGLYIYGAIERNPYKKEFDDVDVYFLPWFSEEKVKALFQEKRDDIQSLTDAYQIVLDNIRADFREGKKHFIISHSYITNSETSTSDRAATIGFASQVDSNVFNGFDYVALGHLHKPQDVTNTIRYSGTPMPYSFGGEERQEKSVTIIDTNDMSKEIIPLRLFRKRNTFTGTYDEIKNLQCSDEDKNGYVKIQLTDTYLGLEVFSTLREIYPNLIEVSGKSMDRENATITMTVDDLQNLQNDPISICRHFIEEETGFEITDHFIELLNTAISEVNKEESEEV